MPDSELIYCSTVAPKTNLAAIYDIQATAQFDNPGRGITGLLVFSSRYFLQVLEGPAGAVDALYERIGKDNRHRNTTLISLSAISERFWANWNMGLLGQTQANRLIFDTYFGGEAFNPYQLSAIAAKRLLQELTDQAHGPTGPKR